MYEVFINVLRIYH